MTRKDYELIAAHLNTGRRQTDPANLQGYDTAIGRLTLALQADNPRFNRVQFLKAAGALT